MEEEDRCFPSTSSSTSPTFLAKEQKKEKEEDIDDQVLDQDLLSHGYQSDSTISSSTPSFSSFASYDMADRYMACEIEEIPSFRYLSPSFRRISRADLHRSSSTTSASRARKKGEEKKEKFSEELSLPLMLARKLRMAAEEAEVFQEECLVFVKPSQDVTDNLQSAANFVASYLFLRNPRRLRLASARCSNSLKLALTFSLRCGSSRVNRLRRSLAGIDSTEFQKPTSLLESSVAYVEWLVSVYSTIARTTVPYIDLTLPPLEDVDPISFWFRTLIGAVVSSDGSKLPDRVAAAHVLTDLARDYDRNKHIMLHEAAVPALLLLIKEPNVESQLVAVTALTSLAGCRKGVSAILAMDPIPTIAGLLSNPIMTGTDEELETQVNSLIALLRPSLPPPKALPG